jgi:DNA repair protein RadA
MNEKSKGDKKMSTEAQQIQELPGVGAATAEKLVGSGFDTLLSIAVSSPAKMVDVAGVTEATARKMINAARDALEMGFESGDELLKKRELVLKLSTSSKSFDAMMGGGFETGSITEMYAPYGGGKTQIAHLMAVNIQKVDPDANTIYIDTEGSFRPERIKQFAIGAKLDPDEVLKHIKVARAYNSDHQMLLVSKAEELIKEGLNVKLLVVDSLTSHFRAEFVGRGTLADRQQKLNKHMHDLAKIAQMYNVCVLVTNQVMAKPDQFFGDPTEAIGGHIVGHNSTFRIYLRKGKKGSRVAKLVDAPNLPDAECSFMVEEDGIKDI